MSKTFAILSGNVVSNIITANTQEDAELVAPGCVEYTDSSPVQIGWIYDTETGEFTSPVEEAPAE